MTVYLDHHAEQVTVTGWKCAKCGRFYGNHDHAERAAQYCCASKQECAVCGAESSKPYTHCAACREKHAAERFAGLERKPFTGGVIYSELLDEWFFCPGSAIEKLEEWWADQSGDDADVDPSRLNRGGDLFESARFLIGEPDNGQEFDVSEFLTDSCPEDGEFSFEGTDEERDLNRVVNAFIESHAPYCYHPSPFAWNGEVAPTDHATDD